MPRQAWDHKQKGQVYNTPQSQGYGLVCFAPAYSPRNFLRRSNAELPPLCPSTIAVQARKSEEFVGGQLPAAEQ